MRQKEALANEVGCLRNDMQQVRDDRDRQLLQVQSLTAELAKCQEFVGQSSANVDTLTVKSNELEVCFTFPLFFIFHNWPLFMMILC